MNLFQSNGISAPANAVLAYLQVRDLGQDEARPTVAPWYNGRERGYVIALPSKNYSHQLNIAFYEHRNSDDICAIMWDQVSMNPLTIDNMNKDVFKDKYDVSHSVSYDKSYEMAEWILARMSEFWDQTSALTVMPSLPRIA